jgi:hypothetical protein
MNCKHCNYPTTWDKAANQRIHVWSGSTWCSMGRPVKGDTVAELQEPACTK